MQLAEFTFWHSQMGGRIMNMLERQAWWILAIGLVTTVVFVVATAALIDTTGHFNMAAFGSLGIYGLTGFVVFVGWKDRRSGRIVMDERDCRIEREATVAGYSIFWIFFVAAAMAPMFLFGSTAAVTLPANAFSLAAMVGMIVMWTARAAAVVYLYRKDNHA